MSLLISIVQKFDSNWILRTLINLNVATFYFGKTSLFGRENTRRISRAKGRFFAAVRQNVKK